ncbi:hypothetical protein AXG93_3911s1210 [Marchantia polymorpha subsp. ruderalis]|uniref:Uncharacterized protein n=1 Tax=Marchantia polymorpha subsp. ruderalis TaxID=1480154 RepID=A0A176W321_MARPO|nr:hypothetical protein AXG93_3911s1210 [Marchantia polymorpha subsp. ruderalis]
MVNRGEIGLKEGDTGTGMERERTDRTRGRSARGYVSEDFGRVAFGGCGVIESESSVLFECVKSFRGHRSAAFNLEDAGETGDAFKSGTSKDYIASRRALISDFDTTTQELGYQ